MKIAISGGGIAGLTAAIYLKQDGHEILVFEKAAAFKRQGYGLSIKTFGIDILKSFGVFNKLKNKGLRVSFFNVYQANGRLIRSIPETVLEQMTGGAFPVARADLHHVLYKLADQQVPILFNKWITNIDHQPQKERITFNDGFRSDFDLVIIAEGLRSTSRQLLCGNEGWRQGNIKYIATLVNQKHGFKVGTAYTYKEVGRSISLFPVDEQQIVIQGYFKNADDRHLQQNEIRALLQSVFSGFTQKVTDLFKNLQEGDYIFYDGVAMIRLPQLVWGRTVLIGNAAYSTTFLSGMGASVSLLGAKLLTEALKGTRDVQSALNSYENKILPISRHFQEYALENEKRELPQNRWQLFYSNLLLRLIPLSVMVKTVADRLAVPKI